MRIEWQTCRWWHIPSTHKVCVITQCQLSCQLSDCLWYCSPICMLLSFFSCCSHLHFPHYMPLWHAYYMLFTNNQIKERVVKRHLRYKSAMQSWICLGMEDEIMWKLTYVRNSMHMGSVSGPDLLSPYLQRPLYCPLLQLKPNSEKKVTPLSKSP